MEIEFLHTKAVREILSLIASGIYKSGQRLPAERKLCDRFGISRGTLRKALADLEKMGAIKVRPQSGAYVQKFSQKKISSKVLPNNFNNVSLKDVVMARKAIELAAIEQACERMTKKELASLEKLINGMEESIDSLPDFLNIDMCFHELIVRASRNSALIAAFEAISEYHKYSQVFSSSSPQCEDDALIYHKKILNALRKVNGKSAVKMLKGHFENMLESVS